MTKIEKYFLEPRHHLSNLDLLTALIGYTLKGSKNKAMLLMAEHDDIRRLARLEARELAEISGIDKNTAIRLHSAFELGRRSMRPNTLIKTILNSNDVQAYFGSTFFGKDVEEFWAVYLDRRNRVLQSKMLSRGNPERTLVDPRQVFRHGLLCGAWGVIIAHNHPSGNPEPSAQDICITNRLSRAGRLLNIKILDHLIFGDGHYHSFSKEGELPIW